MEVHLATFQIAADLIAAQYDRLVRQAQVLDFLEELEIDPLVTIELEELEALRKVCAEFVRMTLNIFLVTQEGSKPYLFHALRDFSMSKEPSRSPTRRLH